MILCVCVCTRASAVGFHDQHAKSVSFHFAKYVGVFSVYKYTVYYLDLYRLSQKYQGKQFPLCRRLLFAYMRSEELMPF